MSGSNKRSVGRPVDHQKTAKVFETIDEILSQDGITHLSIERVAKNAGISKATLYRRFGDLKGLLTAYVGTFTQETIESGLANTSSKDIRERGELERQLNHLGVELMWLISKPRIVAFDNAILAAGPELNELKQAMYRNGPQMALNSITELLTSAGVRKAGFGASDLADILFHLWRSGFYDKVRFSGEMHLSKKELVLHIESATPFFLSSLTIEEHT